MGGRAASLGKLNVVSKEKGEVMKTRDQINQRVHCTPIRLLLAVGVSCLLIQSANATLLFSDGFDYTVGSTLGGNVNPGNSIAWSGGSAGLSIGSGNLTYPGLLDLGGNSLVISNASATSTINTYASQTAGTVFYSFLFDPLVANGGNNYFTALNNPSTGSSGAPNGGSDVIDAYFYAAGSLRLRANAQAAVGATTLSLGTTYFIVMEYDIDNKIASMWLNPTPGAAMPGSPYAQITGTTGTSLNNVGFKAASSTGKFLVDNVMVGTTWEDVTQAIPEPSTWALLVSGLALMFGMIRRRRS
jgi:hypothetical protein